jgi:hypothetical protein
MTKLALLLSGLAVLATALSGWGSAAGTKTPLIRLQPFGSCAALVDYAKLHAAPLAGRGEIGTPPGILAAPAASPAGATGPDFSTTNVQEAGVDEPDSVKTDGTYIFAVVGGKLHAVQARGAPRLLGSLSLASGWGHQLLLRNGRLLVLSSAGSLIEPQIGRMGIIAPQPTSTVLTEIDVSHPAAMRVVSTATIDGTYLTARLTGATARVVIASAPQFPLPEPGAVASSGLRTWLPYAKIVDRRTGRTSTRPLVQCRHVRRPPVFSGVGLVTVVTVDLAKGLPPIDADAVMMGAGTVYASPGSLYIASQRWLTLPPGQLSRWPQTGTTTEIHRFDTSRAGRTDYRSSGSVPGFLLNQWSLSEYKGDLRVASTAMPLWWNPTPQQTSESFVSVLSERAGKLVEIGRVGGLGRGERVYAVRFLDDLGFVVTFRQVDPLYTIALGDPTRPRVLGELKLLGYSAYLHPLGSDRLLGVGQDATADGRILGTQVSLFDVADPSKPARVAALPLGPGSAQVEYDSHAFLYWTPKSLAVLPVQIVSGSTPFVGVVVLRIRRNGVEQLGRVAHPEGVVNRAVVAGDRLYTVSDQGIEASGLDTFQRIAWLPFA